MARGGEERERERETKDEMTGKVWEGRKQIKQLGKREGRASLLSPLFSTDWFLCSVGVERERGKKKRSKARGEREKQERQTDGCLMIKSNYYCNTQLEC